MPPRIIKCAVCAGSEVQAWKTTYILDPYQEQSWGLFLYYLIFGKQPREPQRSPCSPQGIYRKGKEIKRGRDGKSQKDMYEQDLRILVGLLVCIPRPHICFLAALGFSYLLLQVGAWAAALKAKNTGPHARTRPSLATSCLNFLQADVKRQEELPWKPTEEEAVGLLHFCLFFPLSSQLPAAPA